MRPFFLPLFCLTISAAPSFAASWDEAACRALADEVLTLWGVGETYGWQAERVEAQGDGCMFHHVELSPVDHTVMDGIFSTSRHRNAQEVQVELISVSGDALHLVADPASIPSELAVSAKGLRIFTNVGSASMAYLDEVRTRGQFFAFSFQAGWDAEGKRLDLDLEELSFPDGDKISLQLVAEAVDLSSPEARLMSFGSFRLVKLSLDARIVRMFEQFLLMPVLLHLEMQPPDDRDDDSPEDFWPQTRAEMEGRFQEWKKGLREGLEAWPATNISSRSKSALADLIDDLPTPRGRFRLELRSEHGVGSAQAMMFSMRRTAGASVAERLKPFLEQIEIEAEWEPSLAE